MKTTGASDFLSPLLSEDLFQKSLVTTVESFARTAARNFAGLLAVNFIPAQPEFMEKGIASERDVFVSILFTGSVYGEFILALSEETAVRLLGESLQGKTADEKRALRESVLDTLSEILNVTVGESVLALNTVYKKLTITPPRVHFGQVNYPKIKAARMVMSSEVGEIDCYLYIDRMKLDIAESYRSALTSLLVAHRKLQDAMKQLEQQQEHIRQAEKMAALGTMAGGVAHELNTPLATIKVIESQLRDMISDDPIDRALFVEMLDTVDETLEKMAAITDTLRVYARDQSPEPFRSTPVAVILKEALLACHQNLEKAGVHLSMDEVPSEITAECRPHQIAQVFHALLSNAFDAAKGAQEKWIKINFVDHKDFVEFRVMDSGPGVPSEIRERLFDPFFTTKGIGKGVGLGLSLAKGMIEAHRGTIFLNTKAPHTQFIVRFPKHIQEQRKTG